MPDLAPAPPPTAEPRTPTPGAASGRSRAYEQILAEHRELRQTIRMLKDYVTSPRPDITDAEHHAWAEGLANKLLALHERLSAHFREEETAGLFEQIVTSFPRTQRVVRNLEKEHLRMLRELRALIPEALRYAESRPDSGLGLRRRTLALLDLLQQHEARESELMECLYTDDIGAGD